MIVGCPISSSGKYSMHIQDKIWGGEGWKTGSTMSEWHWKYMESDVGTKHFVHFVFRILQKMPFSLLWSTVCIPYYERGALIRDCAPHPKSGVALGRAVGGRLGNQIEYP